MPTPPPARTPVAIGSTGIPSDPPPLPCAHYDAGRCRSCTLLPVRTRTRIDDLQEQLSQLLAPFAQAAPPQDADSQAVPVQDAPHLSRAPSPWRAPVRSPEAGFRNKAKMVAGGTAEAPTLGLVDVEGHGIDLSDCPLYPPAIHAALAALPALIRRAQVSPYDVARRRGELKHVLITASPDGELMVRFVLRTARPAPRLQEHIALLTDPVAANGFQVRVVTANIQPEHAAVLEGPDEIHLHGDEALTVRQGRIPLRVRPQSFLQTNTHVASQLYEQVASWVDDCAPAEAAAAEALAATQRDSPFVVWDLFCGVGGFALHCAKPIGDASRKVLGVEVSEQAIDSATRTAQDLGLDVEFTTADAALFATGDEDGGAARDEHAHRPDLLIVNPPRRGLGRDLAAWVEGSRVRDVIYSSCNPTTLAHDLQTMSSYRITAARLLDMFPHTAHAEVVVRLRRG